MEIGGRFLRLLQNHLFARIIEDHLEVLQHTEAYVAGETSIHGRAFDEKIRVGFVELQCADLQLGQMAAASRRAAAYAEFSARAGFAFFEQVVRFDKIMAKTNSTVAPGVDLEFAGNDHVVRFVDCGIDDRRGAAAAEAEWNHLTFARVDEIRRCVECELMARKIDLHDILPK